MRLRTVVYLEEKLLRKINGLVDNKRENLIFNKETKLLFTRSCLINMIIKAFINSNLSLEDFCKQFISIKQQFNQK